MKYSKNYFNPITVKKSSVFNIYKEFISQYGIDLNKAICDIGCATGDFFQTIKLNKNSLGIDISEFAIKRCREVFPNYKKNFVCLNINEEVIDPKKKFDIITMFDVIEHLDNFVNFKKIIQTNLKNNGYLIITTPNAQSFLRFLSIKTFTGEYDKTHTMLFTPYTLDFFLRKCGLVRIDIFTPYTFYFKKNYLTQTLLLGGQIFAIYRKKGEKN